MTEILARNRGLKSVILKSPILLTLGLQLAVLLPVVGLVYCVYQKATVSLLLGALVFVLPNLLFTRYTFRYRGANNAIEIYRSFQFGETVKLVATVLGFALVFKYVQQLNILVFFAAYVSMVTLQFYIAGKHLAKTV
ncbi:MAG: ATP synthase protein I [Flavobacteriales bacterium]|jgi:ATP synthase protein I